MSDSAKMRKLLQYAWHIGRLLALGLALVTLAMFVVPALLRRPESPPLPPTCAGEAAYWCAVGRQDLAEKTCGSVLRQLADQVEENRRAILALARENEVKP